MSIVFDRAVEYYDQTRSLPEEIAELPIEALVCETGLGPGARVLEIGIGTGRIAIPLAAKLGRLTGVDLSLRMMSKLKGKVTGSALPLDLASADAVHLPFPDGCFHIIYAVHVLHLVKGWRNAVAEAKRALAEGGFFAVSWHRRDPDSPNALLRKELHRLVETRGVNTRRPGTQSEAEILEELEGWGGELKIADVAEWTEPCKPGEIIDELDRQIYSETWMIPRNLMDELIPLLRNWAVDKFGSLDRNMESPYNFRWLIVRKP